jgi:hypothetical protein
MPNDDDEVKEADECRIKKKESGVLGSGSSSIVSDCLHYKRMAA